MKTILINLSEPRKNFIFYIRYAIYLIVFYGFSIAYAGSYEDFFNAVRKDDADTIAGLVGRGFDANVRDPEGQHALHLAIRNKSLKSVNALLNWSKIDVEPRNKVDESPVMLAALDGQTEVAKRLVSLGADVNKPGWAPLHYAATRGHLDILAFLLEQHAYIDAVSPNGTTPLMMAAFYGTPSAVKLLLEGGADPLLKNQQGLTAIDFAHRNNRADSAGLIAAFIRARQPKGKW